MSSSSSKQSVLSNQKKLAEGFLKHLAALGNLVTGDQTFTPADVQAHAKACDDTEQAVGAARGVFHDAVAAARKAREDARPAFAAIKELALHRFAGKAEILADFGLKPKVLPHALTAEEKAAAAALGQRTRKARNTMGPRQRAKVKGTPPRETPPTPPTPTRQ
jgi:hypothetical protein